MSRIEIIQFKYLSDNYGILLHDKHTKKTVAIDAGDKASYNKALDAQGWQLSEIWVTHHHWDHTDGIQGLYERWQCKVIGPAKDSTVPIAHLSQGITEGNSFLFADSTVKVIHTPGHTLDMINFYLPSHQVKINYIDVENFEDINSLSLESSNTKDILMVGDYRNLFPSLSSSFYSDTTFYHNPYMNQMWSKIQTYRMQSIKNE